MLFSRPSFWAPARRWTQAIELPIYLVSEMKITLPNKAINEVQKRNYLMGGSVVLKGKMVLVR